MTTRISLRWGHLGYCPACYAAAGRACQSKNGLPLSDPHSARMENVMPQPLDHVRPLAIGAAYTDEFEALAPPDWSAGLVLAQLFKCLPMENAGWTEETTELHDLGAKDYACRWRVRRGR